MMHNTSTYIEEKLVDSVEGKRIQVITIVTGFISEPLDRHRRSLVTKQTGCGSHIDRSQ